MKEQWEQECADLRAELAALHKQLHALETKQAGTKVNAPPIFRRRLSKGAMLILLPIVVLVVAGGVLYGQGAMDAFFIAQSGNVGVGTSSPTATLDVSGKANIDKQISLQLRSGNTSADYNSNQITFGYNGADSYRHAIKTRHHGGQQKGNAIDFYVWKYDEKKVDPTAIGGLQTMTLDGGNVGIGTTDPKAKLEVNGRIKDQTGYVMPVGSIVAYHGAAAPDGWLWCDGSTIPQEDKYKDLKGLLGKSTTPDLRGRTLIGGGQGAGLTVRGLGQQGGEENHKLTIDEMPAHHHHGFGEAYDPYWPFGRVGPKGQKGSRGGVDEDNFYYNTSDTGGNKLFNNMQPFYVVNYIIKY